MSYKPFDTVWGSTTDYTDQVVDVKHSFQISFSEPKFTDGMVLLWLSSKMVVMEIFQTRGERRQQREGHDLEISHSLGSTISNLFSSLLLVAFWLICFPVTGLVNTIILRLLSVIYGSFGFLLKTSLVRSFSLLSETLLVESTSPDSVTTVEGT